MRKPLLTKGDIIAQFESEYRPHSAAISVDTAIPLEWARKFEEDTGENATEHFVGTVYPGSWLLPMTLLGWEWVCDRRLTGSEGRPQTSTPTRSRGDR